MELCSLFSASPLLLGFGDFDARRDTLPSVPFPGDLGASSSAVALLSTSVLFLRPFGDLDDDPFELVDFGDFAVSMVPVDARRDDFFGDLE